MMPVAPVKEEPGHGLSVLLTVDTPTATARGLLVPGKERP